MLENRAGVQLLELTVTIAVAGILIAGSSSAIFIAGQANEKAFAAAGTGSENAHVVNLIRSDLESAQHIAIHGNDVLIHNKNSDGGTEVIGYSWSGPGGPLKRTIQGSGQAITGSLDHAPLLWQTARPQKSVPTTNAALEITLAATSEKTELLARSINAVIPETFVGEGLLVACVAVTGNVTDSLVVTPGWQRATVESGGSWLGRVTLGIFYTTTLQEACQIQWSGFSDASVCVSHFYTSKQLMLVDSVTKRGSSTVCHCPEIVCPESCGLVLRACALVMATTSEDATCLPDSHSVCMFSPGLGPTVGLCYQTQAGNLPEAAFAVPISTNYVTASIAFGP